MKILNNILLLFISTTSILIGFYLGKITKEELKYSKKHINAITFALKTSLLTTITYLTVYNNKILITIITLIIFIAIFYLEKIRSWILIIILTSINIFIFSNNSKMIIITLFFLYSFTLGLKLKADQHIN